jgi:hypothetical protein
VFTSMTFLSWLRSAASTSSSVTRSRRMATQRRQHLLFRDTLAPHGGALPRSAVHQNGVSEKESPAQPEHQPSKLPRSGPDAQRGLDMTVRQAVERCCACGLLGHVALRN